MLGFFREDPLFKPTSLFEEDTDFPKTVILTWQDGFERELFDRYSPAEYSKRLCVGGLYSRILTFEPDGSEAGSDLRLPGSLSAREKNHSQPCKTSPRRHAEFPSHGKRPIAFALIPAGGPVVSMVMEELHALGANRFCFIGSSGCFSEKAGDSLILPTAALRDEGTSWHYIPDKELCIAVDTAEATENFLSGAKIPFVKGATWTTDAIYRETSGAMKKAHELGCICVEMECASIMAVARGIGVEAYQILFTADRLTSESWDIGRLKNMKKAAHAVYLDVIVGLATHVDGKTGHDRGVLNV